MYVNICTYTQAMGPQAATSSKDRVGAAHPYQTHPLLLTDTHSAALPHNSLLAASCVAVRETTCVLKFALMRANLEPCVQL